MHSKCMYNVAKAAGFIFGLRAHQLINKVSCIFSKFLCVKNIDFQLAVFDSVPRVYKVY